MSAPAKSGSRVRELLEALTVDGFPRLSFTVEEVEAMTAIPRRTWYRLIETGRVDVKRVGRRCYPTVEGLIRFYEDQECAIE